MTPEQIETIARRMIKYFASGDDDALWDDAEIADLDEDDSEIVCKRVEAIMHAEYGKGRH